VTMAIAAEIHSLHLRCVFDRDLASFNNETSFAACWFLFVCSSCKVAFKMAWCRCIDIRPYVRTMEQNVISCTAVHGLFLNR